MMTFKNLKLNICLVLFVLLMSITIFANDGGQYYWGPASIRTEIDQKTVKCNNGLIKVYDGAGKSFNVNEFAKIPNGVKVSVYGDITVDNTTWSLIKYLYIENINDISWFAHDYSETEEEFVTRYTKLSLDEQYKLLLENYGFAKKGYGWVESKYLINEEENKNYEIDENIKQESDEQIIKRSDADKEIVKEDRQQDNENIVKKKRSILDIIKDIFNINR